LKNYDVIKEIEIFFGDDMEIENEEYKEVGEGFERGKNEIWEDRDISGISGMFIGESSGIFTKTIITFFNSILNFFLELFQK